MKASPPVAQTGTQILQTTTNHTTNLGPQSGHLVLSDLVVNSGTLPAIQHYGGWASPTPDVRTMINLTTEGELYIVQTGEKDIVVRVKITPEQAQQLSEIFAGYALKELL